MSEERQILLRTASTIFEKISTHEQFSATERGQWNPDNWAPIEESGLDQALVPGGFDVADALAIVRCAGNFALPLPLIETMIANRILAELDIPLPGGVISLGVDSSQLNVQADSDSWQVSGQLPRVPWGRFADHILTATDDAVLLLSKESVQIEADANVAGEARDTIIVDSNITAGAKGASPWPLLLAGAAIRSIQIAGALEKLLEMTTEYANERKQFGRSIGKFQAIQQYMAQFAGHAAAASAAADIAVEALASDASELSIAIAKARTSEAVGQASALAHQVHGAMGVTHEHMLQFYTRRLWSWRDEYGSESTWNKRIGKAFTTDGADSFWPHVVAI